jgi:hypothetical protein
MRIRRPNREGLIIPHKIQDLRARLFLRFQKSLEGIRIHRKALEPQDILYKTLASPIPEQQLHIRLTPRKVPEWRELLHRHSSKIPVPQAILRKIHVCPRGQAVPLLHTMCTTKIRITMMRTTMMDIMMTFIPRHRLYFLLRRGGLLLDETTHKIPLELVIVTTNPDTAIPTIITLRNRRLIPHNRAGRTIRKVRGMITIRNIMKGREVGTEEAGAESKLGKWTRNI